MIKTFTARDVVDNIEKNGLPQTTGSLFRRTFGGRIYNLTDFDEKPIIGSACALGQAAINLGVVQYFVDDITLKDSSLDMKKDRFLSRVIHLNDSVRLNFAQIAITLKIEFGAELDEIKWTAKEFDYTPFLPEGYNV